MINRLNYFRKTNPKVFYLALAGDTIIVTTLALMIFVIIS